MRTGKLNISRGSKLAESPAQLSQLTLVPAAENAEPEAESAGEAPDAGIGSRVELLERLARLHSLDLLSAEEFASEKSRILGRPVIEASATLRSSPQGTDNGAVTGTSLIGLAFNWKFLPIGLVAGLALSFGAQPQETVRFLDQALRLAGV